MSDVLSRLAAALADRYRFERELGQGGMATVYLAQDIRHDRRVALKVLKPELAAVIGAERFLQEIKTTANLQHPHILGLIDSGETGGLLWYVMPFVEGESLRDRLQREKQLPVEDAVRLTSEVASALDYAHRRGVIHRDIKPENILLHDNRALVADFGIALAVSSAGPRRMTETGMSLGTPQYMSPEQAMGDRALDARSDVYSLGAVLYEMLAGDPPYTGSNAQAIVAKVLTERAPIVTAVRDTVPPHVAGAIHKSLSKLPADRFGSAAEFADALTRPGSYVFATSAPTGMVGLPLRRIQPVWIAGGVVLFALGVALGWVLRRPIRLAAFPVTFSLETDSTHSFELNRTRSLAVSNDGTRIAYLGRSLQGVVKLFERRMGEPSSRAITGTEGADHPFYSPDGAWIAFDADGALKKVSTAGGSAVVVARVGGATTSGSWGPNGSIVYSAGARRPLFLIPADGGAPQQLTSPDSAGGESQLWPCFLPDGRTVVFTNSRIGPNGSQVQLGVLDLSSRKVRLFDVRALGPTYLASGDLIYGLEDGSLVKQPFDPEKPAFTGPAVRLVEGIDLIARVFPAYAASPSGVMVYYPSQSGGTLATLVDRNGTEHPVFSAPDLWSPRFSPTGDRVAFSRAGGAAGGGRDLWVYSLRDQTMARLTRQFNAVDGSWSRDGKRLVFSGSGSVATPSDLYGVDADGSSDPSRLLERPDGQFQPIFTSGGAEVVFMDRTTGGDRLMRLALGPGASPEFLSRSGSSEASPALSPDGRWLAFHSNESGQTEVYVRPYPGPGSRVVISSSGGAEPVWSGNGQELFYRSGTVLVAAQLRIGSEVSVTGRKLLFSVPYLRGRGNRNFDVRPDAGQFVFVKNSIPPRLVVRVNALAPEPR